MNVHFTACLWEWLIHEWKHALLANLSPLPPLTTHCSVPHTTTVYSFLVYWYVHRCSCPKTRCLLCHLCRIFCLEVFFFSVVAVKVRNCCSKLENLTLGFLLVKVLVSGSGTLPPCFLVSVIYSCMAALHALSTCMPTAQYYSQRSLPLSDMNHCGVNDSVLSLFQELN